MTIVEYYIDRTYSAFAGLSARMRLEGKSGTFVVRSWEYTEDGEWLMHEVFGGTPSKALRILFAYILWKITCEDRDFVWGRIWYEAGHVILESKDLPKHNYRPRS